MKVLEIKKYIPKAKIYYQEIEIYYQDLFNKNDFGFKHVIRQAAEAQIICNGKRTFADHQHRIGRKRCEQGANELLKSKNFQDLNNANSFEDIFVITERVKNYIYRLGDLWSYDTAQRIALSKGFYPKEVYIHAGAKDGTRLLVKSSLLNSSEIRGKRKISPSVFPKELSKLEPYLIENILCVGKRESWF